MSTTCPFPINSQGKSLISWPQKLQYWGIWSVILSGVEVIFKVLPSWPGWPPGFFPVRSRKLFVFNGRFSSLDGGSELFLLFFTCSYLANFSHNIPFSCSKCSTRLVN